MAYLLMLSFSVMGYVSQIYLYRSHQDKEDVYDKRWLEFAAVISGVLVGGVFLKEGCVYETLLYSAMMVLLVFVTLCDFAHYIIHDEINLALLIVGLLISFGDFAYFESHVDGFILSGLVFFLVAVITGGLLGGGDIKLIAVLGLSLGLKSIFLVILGSLFVSGIYSVAGILARKFTLKSVIPFGPFIAFSAALVYFFY